MSLRLTLMVAVERLSNQTQMPLLLVIEDTRFHLLVMVLRPMTYLRSGTTTIIATHREGQTITKANTLPLTMLMAQRFRLMRASMILTALALLNFTRCQQSVFH